ncbi:hypothetical protein [Silvimonas sp.]|uniref:hypothetical protein n=1 Tax=Silvimonas sp. TaxID=2650811 RepID=UPI00284051CC|nr:hypothetical protein [Silvimonas sp.]MDR3427800.1 hypothetical protein [Silvimonas sp.]
MPNPIANPIPYADNATPPPSVLNLSTVQSVSTQMVSLAEAYMGSLIGAGWFSAPSISPDFPEITTPPAPVTANMPTLQAVSWSVPAQPSAFGVKPPDVAGLLPGPFTGTPPSLVFGTMPVVDYGTAPAAPAVDLNFTMPTLDLNLPAAPSLLSISVKPFNGVTLPTLSVNVPSLTAVAPNIIPYEEGATYASLLLSSLINDLNSAVADGSYLTLNQQVQDGLWDAGREREYRQQADALAELDRMESLGYAFPPGVYLDSRLKVQTETNNTIAGISRDIMTKQAELQLENLTKAREQAVMLEGKQLDYANEQAQRAFESTKFTAQAAIEIYNANVEAYKASLEGYRTQATIFDTLMRGAQTQVDIYKAELDGERLKVDMDTALIQQYESQIRAQSLFVDIYKAELGAIETQANLQKIIVEAYGEEIRAFVAKVNAFSSEVEAYKAQIDAQGVVQNTYKTAVEAYAAEVNAGASEATALIEGFKAQVSAYSTQLEGYRAAVTGMAEQARAASEYNSAAADVYRSEMTAIASYNDVLTKQWQATMDISEKIAEVGVQAAKANGDLFISTKNIAVEAAKGGAQVAAQLGAAALGAVHFSQSNAWSSSLSAGISYGVSNSYSGINSVSSSTSAAV